MRHIKEIIIHCTATRQGITSEDIKNLWKSRGWKIGGYHFIIYEGGHTEKAVPIEQISNGCHGHNAHAINVAYVGGIDAKGQPCDNRTEEQKTALLLLARQLHRRFPRAAIIGHREVYGRSPVLYKKMCPCFDVAEIRAQL